MGESVGAGAKGAMVSLGAVSICVNVNPNPFAITRSF